MKKNLLIIGLLALMMPLSAETLNICKAFEKLLTNVNDFKPLMAGKDPKNPLAYLSTFQLEGAESASFITDDNTTRFEADLGSYQTDIEATRKKNEWEKSFITCFPTMKLLYRHHFVPVLKTEFSYYHPSVQNETTIRVYDAAFCISKIISTYDLIFEFHQAQHAYTEYTLINQEQVKSPFGETLSAIIKHADDDVFEEIKGEILQEDISGEDLAYATTLKIPGYSDSYIGVNLDNESRYVVNLCVNVEKSSFETTRASFLKALMSAMGKGFAYSTSANEQTIDFVKTSYLFRKVATFSFTEKNGKYTAHFMVYAPE